MLEVLVLFKEDIYDVIVAEWVNLVVGVEISKEFYGGLIYQGNSKEV